MKVILLFALTAIVGTHGQGGSFPNNCGIHKIMEATSLLTQTIKDTPFPEDDNGFFATVCSFYQRYLDYIDVASVTCNDGFLDALRVVARVGGFYHRLAGRCPRNFELRPDSINIDSEHVYPVRPDDVSSCGGKLRGDDNCVKNWVAGIKDGADTCDNFRSGILCHRDWHEANCGGRDDASIITKARNELNVAYNVLLSLQKEECANMTP